MPLTICPARAVLPAALAALLALVPACSSGELHVNPAARRLTDNQRAFADTLPRSEQSVALPPIPRLVGVRSTDRFASAGSWFLLYLKGEFFGRAQAEYFYEQNRVLFPFWNQTRVRYFDPDGARRVGYDETSVGLNLLVLDLLSFKLGGTQGEHLIGGRRTDFGFFLLRIPVLDAALLRLSSTGVDLLFLPLWRVAEEASPPS